MTSNGKHHLESCKRIALARLQYMQMPSAMFEFFKEMEKHPETQGHVALNEGKVLLYSGCLTTAKQMEEFLNAIA